MDRISWLGEHGLTLNPGIWGCSPCGPACDHCYASRMARRLEAMGVPGYHSDIVTAGGEWTGQVFTTPISEALFRIRQVPRIQANRTAGYRPGDRRRVFVTSMADILHEQISLGWVASCVRAMALRTDIDWMLLTKRGHRWPELVRVVLDQIETWPSNVWPGVTVWDQESADRLIPPLLQVTGGIRWVSVEPMLGPIQSVVETRFQSGEVDSSLDWLTGRHGYYAGGWFEDCGPRIAWVICGPENGPGRRPMEMAWAEDLYRQCKEAGVPYWWKPGGGRLPQEEPNV
jgi:protein gp37